MKFTIKSADLSGVITLSIKGGATMLRTSDQSNRPFINIGELINPNKFIASKRLKLGTKMPEFEFVKTIVKHTLPRHFNQPSATSFKEATGREPVRTKGGYIFEFKNIQEVILAHGLDWAYSSEPCLKGCLIEIKMMPAVGDSITVSVSK